MRRNIQPLSILSAVLASTTVAAAQVRVSAPIRIDFGPGGTASNETTQSASLADPTVGVSGWNDYRNNIKSIFGVTRDGGETWTEFIVRPPVANQSTVEGDPHGAYDNRTGTLWAGGISFSGNGGVYAARLEPDKVAFEPTKMIQATGGADKGWMAAGPDPSDASKTRVYCSYNLGTARSADMGDTWQGPVSLGSGIGFLPRVGPGGEVYVAYWDFGTNHLLRRSFNGGLSFDPAITIAVRMDVWAVQDNPRVPGAFRAPSLQGLAVDPNDGTLYFVYPDTTAFGGGNADVDVYFTKSTNQGTTWSTPVVINGDSPFVGDQFFPWVEVDETGRVHVNYYDTRHTQQNDSNGNCILDAYYAYSEDQGQSWTEVRLTPVSFSSANDGFGSGFIGDYIGMSAGGGRALPVYMRTDPVSAADSYTNVVLHGPAQAYCRGILCPCGNDDPERGCGNDGIDGNAATGAELSGTGSPTIAADDLVLTITGMKGNQFGLLFVGPAAGAGTSGDGRLCLSGSLHRYPVKMSNGAGELSYGPNEMIAYAVANFPAAFQPQPGETWYYQAFYRDPQGPCGATFNSTNGLSVLWE